MAPKQTKGTKSLQVQTQCLSPHLCLSDWHNIMKQCLLQTTTHTIPPTAVFLNRRVAARYRARVSIIPGRERFSWNLSFQFSMHFSWISIL